MGEGIERKIWQLRLRLNREEGLGPVQEARARHLGARVVEGLADVAGWGQHTII